MRKLLFLGLALSLTTAVVLAQSHQNTAEKAVKQTIDFSTDIKVGDVTLKAGEYRVTCDRETITFRGPDGKLTKFPCKGEELAEPSDHNEIHMGEASGGGRVLTKLLLRGSNVQHVFQ